MAWTNTPRGFFRSRSASCGVSNNLFDDEGGETFGLIWSRGRRSNGD
jgi:uncharacterized protein (DUF736 family)